MTITVLPPLDTPVATATPGTGGTLPSGTYYVRVTAKENNYYASEQPGKRKSCPSVEVSCAVDGSSTNAIDVSWDAVTGAVAYNVYVRPSTASNYTGSRRKATANTALTVIGSTAYKITSIATDMWGPMDFLGWDTTRYPAPCGLDVREMGTIQIDITGTCGTLSYENVKAAVDAAGLSAYMTTDGHDFVVKGGINIVSGATGTMNLYAWATSPVTVLNPRFYFLDGYIWNYTSGFLVNTGDPSDYAACEMQVFVWSWRYTLGPGTHRNHIARGSWASGFPSVSIIGGADNYLNIDSTAGDVTGLVSLGLNLQIYKSPVADLSTTSNISMLVTNGVATRCRARGYVMPYSVNGTRWVDCTLGGGSGGYMLRMRDNMGALPATYFLNCRFFYISTEYVQPPAYWIRYENSYSDNHVAYVGFTFDLTVVDLGGFGVPLATVRCLDKNGAQVFSATTDSEGKIATQDLLRWEYRRDPAVAYPHTTSLITDMAPYSLTVSKEGYRDEHCIITPSMRVASMISLAPLGATALLPLPDGILQSDWESDDPIAGFVTSGPASGWKTGELELWPYN